MRISDWSSDVCSSDLLESGPHALVERSRDFPLVPWRDVLERHVGKSASGIIQAAGISWTFGRARGGPAISCCCWPAGVSARADDPERQVLGSESRLAVIPTAGTACQNSALWSVFHEPQGGLSRTAG